MFKNIMATLKGIAAVVAFIIVMVLFVVVGPLVLLAGLIALGLFIGYIVYYINKEAPELIQEFKDEMAKE